MCEVLPRAEFANRRFASQKHAFLQLADTEPRISGRCRIMGFCSTLQITHSGHMPHSGDVRGFVPRGVRKPPVCVPKARIPPVCGYRTPHFGQIRPPNQCCPCGESSATKTVAHFASVRPPAPSGSTFGHKRLPSCYREDHILQSSDPFYLQFVCICASLVQAAC